LTRHHQKVRIGMTARPFDRVVANLQLVAPAAPAASRSARTGTRTASARRKIGRRPAAPGGNGSRRGRDRWNRTAAWIQRARRRAFRASSHRINLADDVDAERLKGDEVWNVGVETAGGAEPLPEIHVVVM